MRKICDLHLHSKYSGGASQNINLYNLASNSMMKGIDILGTGDCLHPTWLSEIKSELIEYSSGLFQSPLVQNVNLILQSEIEVIWKLYNKIKKVHLLLLFPSLEKLDEGVDFLSKYGNLKEEGRPKIFSTPETLTYGLKSIDEHIEIIPAHIFTPYFGMFGENPEFSTLKEVFGNSWNYINSVETGLSADPVMLRKISELNKVSIISNSDSHSTNFHRLGREATILNMNKLNYPNLIDSLKRNKIIKSYELKPSQGKYYYDGCRSERHNNKNDYFCSPKLKINTCPFCKRKLTKGVLSRVHKLSDQISPFKLNFQYIVPLLYLITLIQGGTEYSKENLSIYRKLISSNNGEYNIWEGKSNFQKIPEKLIDAINKVRNGKFWFIPGHDAVYGKLQFEI